MRIPRLVLFTVLALVLAIVFISNVFGQTYKRHALIEESTGTWCQYCPFGAYLIDSAEKKMKDYAVVISYHGPLGTQNDPMWIAQADTMNDNYPSASSGYPWAVIGRDAATSNRNLWDAQAEFDAGEAPLVDFRVVNATFNSSNHSVDFDLDITPIVLGQTPTEDTATFVVIAAVTEDGIVAPQELNGVGTIDNFVHHNVARAFGSKVMGDAIVLGTKTSVSWPVRKHYHISTSDKGVNDFVQDSIRIKAFVARRSKTASNGEVYLDAGQTTYITKLPSNATRSVWPVLPQAGQMVSGTTMPVVWGRGGGAASSVKIEYSLDNGTTWNLVVASTNTSPYQWALPDTVFGQNLVLRVTDAQDASLDSTTGVFSIAPKPYFTVEYPKTNDTLWVGDTVQINLTYYGASENVTLEY
ncbi:MAG: hypothetical protein Q8922_13290, partial [Bacteroidota bacterium]|nr:hypothetical protein [Bacteroidota bacterium]